MKVIKHSNLPTRLPVITTVVVLLALDHWQASEVTRGVFYTILVILWIASIVMVIKEKQVDIFDGKK